MNAVMEERDQMLRVIAQHVVDGNYTYSDIDDLNRLISNKIGHDLADMKEVKLVEKHIKEIRAGR